MVKNILWQNRDIIKKSFDREAFVVLYMAYLHGLSELPWCPRYIGDINKSRSWLNLLTIYNDAMLGAAQFMLDFLGIHLNSKKSLYIKFQKHASIFCKAMLSTINGVGHVRWYVLPTSVCAIKNSVFPMENR